MVRRRGAKDTGPAVGGAPTRVPAPKLNGGNSNLGRSGRRKPPGKVAITFALLVIVICVAVGVAGFVGLAVELQYRAGWAGTPGTVSMISCETVGSGRTEHTDCDGEFETGRGAVPTSVSIEGDSTYASHRAYPARLHSDGQTVSVVGGKSTAYVLGGMFAALGFIVFAGWMVAAVVVGVIVRRRAGQRVRMGKRVVLAPLITGGVLLALGIAGGIVGACLSF